MTEKCGLSEKNLCEQYEDLVFKKVMSLYAEKESEKILSELEPEDFASEEGFEKLLAKYKKKKAKKAVLSALKKLSLFAAAFILVATVSVASVVVVPAKTQKAIREFLGPLFYAETHESIDIGANLAGTYVDPELYTIENAVVPTWMPDGYVLEDYRDIGESVYIKYVNSEKELIIMEEIFSESRNYHLDFDEGDTSEEITIGDFSGILITKNGGSVSYLFMSDGKTDVLIFLDEKPEVTMTLAESMKPLPEELLDAPAGDMYLNYYKKLEGAYIPGFIPKSFSFNGGMGSKNNVMVEYDSKNGNLMICESIEKPDFPFDETMAEYYENKSVHYATGEYASFGVLNAVRIKTKGPWILIYGTADMSTIEMVANNMKLLE